MAATIRISSPNPAILNPSILNPANLVAPLLEAGFGRDRQGRHPQSSDPRNIVFLRRRLVLGVLLILVGAMFWTAATWAVNSSIGVDRVGADQSGVTQDVHIVQPGDTLWSIASQLDPGGDVRDTVDRLAELNGGSALRVGQRVALSG